MLTLELVAGRWHCNFGSADVAGLEHACLVYEAVRDGMTGGRIPCPDGFVPEQLVGTYDSPEAGPFTIATDRGGRAVVRGGTRR